jgi:hypothetical protein
MKVYALEGPTLGTISSKIHNILENTGGSVESCSLTYAADRPDWPFHCLLIIRVNGG